MEGISKTGDWSAAAGRSNSINSLTWCLTSTWSRASFRSTAAPPAGGTSSVEAGEAIRQDRDEQGQDAGPRFESVRDDDLSLFENGKYGIGFPPYLIDARTARLHQCVIWGSCCPSGNAAGRPRERPSISEASTAVTTRADRRMCGAEQRLGLMIPTEGSRCDDQGEGLRGPAVALDGDVFGTWPLFSRAWMLGDGWSALHRNRSGILPGFPGPFRTGVAVTRE